VLATVLRAGASGTSAAAAATRSLMRHAVARAAEATMASGLGLRTMTRREVGELLSWADDEGWNPGLHDAELFWRTDPDAFIAAEFDGQWVGGGAITSYGGEYGFMGLFIVRPEVRGRGLGSQLWHARLARLRDRLRPGAPIGMDGVFTMQDWYARGGFVLAHREIRYEGVGVSGSIDASLVPATDLPRDAIAAYDRSCFPAARGRFLDGWLEQPDALALAAVAGERLIGYGVARRCGVGAKIGPLFADDGETAERLFASLSTLVPGEPVFLDVPEINAAAVALVRRQGMRDVFGCARMYVGAPPRLRDDRIFGVTTFELG
jgi:ribosomal protein S18 acetylase RimI-like enzyme